MGREGALGKFVMAAGLMIPVQSEKGWQHFTYGSIQPNKVSFLKEGLEISVNSSASPLIYPLKPIKFIKTIKLSGEFHGNFSIPNGKLQGSKSYDDFRLMIGFVVPGKKKLGFWKRQVAADWIKQLFALAPKNIGIS